MRLSLVASGRFLTILPSQLLRYRPNTTWLRALDVDLDTSLEALAAGFRGRPGFLALWYGGLRTERIRDVTRPTREAIAISVQRILTVHWPGAPPRDRAATARMVVVAGDGLLREAFRTSSHGDGQLLAESRLMLDAYVRARLGASQA